MENSEKYPISIRIIHWLMAILMISLIVVGYVMANYNELGQSLDLKKYHKTFGLFVFILVFVRIIIKLRTYNPSYPQNFSSFMQKISNIVHKLLYLAMIIVPLTGILMSLFGGYGLVIFDYKIPSFVDVDKAFAMKMYNSHGIVAYSALFLIMIHFAGALKHILFDKYNIMKRIWF